MVDNYIISKEKLVNLIEPGLLSRMQNKEYTVEKVAPQTLVTHNRLDIGFRTIYLELKETLPSLADEIYQHDLRSQTLGTLVDPDNSEKYNFEVFKKEFEKISSNIYRNGFDSKLTLIPVSTAGSILNGGHRLATALHFSKDVWVVRTDLPAICCDYDYFFKRSVPVDLIEMAALKLLDFAQDIFVAFLWPSGCNNWHEALNLFTNVIYQKEVEVTFQGAFNLLYQCYKNMDWIGSQENGFAGLEQKRLECFPQTMRFRFVIFQEPQGLKQVRNIKEKVRNINKIGYSSIHITDTNEEAKRLCQFLLNDNALHFLNYTTDFGGISAENLAELKCDMKNDSVSKEHVLVDGSFVFEAYGLRKAMDVDVLVSDVVPVGKLKNWERHDHELSFHGVEKNDLIYNPHYHFKLCEIKVVSLRQMVAFKKRRAKSKDLLDVRIAEALIESDTFKAWKTKLLQKFLYFRLRSTRNMIAAIEAALRFFGLYEFARRTRRRIKGIEGGVRQ